MRALYQARSGWPWVSWAFLGLCAFVTVPSLIWPRLYDVFGGLEPRRYPWQVFTAVFEHGWPGFHGSVHLILNAFLVLECGVPCERLLGSRRFALLCALSAGANAWAQTFTDGVNGSSLVIWSWGPPLWLALCEARREGSDAGSAGAIERLQTVLVVMYVVVTLAMAGLPYLAGWRGDPVRALLLGNLYHLVATSVGIVFACWARRFIRRRLRALAALGKST